MRGRKWRMGGNAKNFNNRAMRLPPPELRLYRVRKALRKFASYAFLHSRAGMRKKVLLAPLLVETGAPVCGKHHVGAVRVALVYFYYVLFKYVFTSRA